MKKIYIQPNVKVVMVRSMQMIADSIGVVNGRQLSGTNAGWAREDNSLDIWGTNADDELE